MNKTDIILDGIKEAYNIKTDKQLADILGLSNQAFYSWRKRDSMQIELLIKAFEDINPLYLIKGEGDVRIENKQNAYNNGELNQLLQEKERIISEQADHIKTLKKSIVMNERVIDMISKSLEIMNEERGKKDVG